MFSKILLITFAKPNHLIIITMELSKALTILGNQETRTNFLNQPLTIEMLIGVDGQNLFIGFDIAGYDDNVIELEMDDLNGCIIYREEEGTFEFDDLDGLKGSVTDVKTIEELFNYANERDIQIELTEKGLFLLK